MKKLLKAIQDQLKTDLTYVRDSDIYVTPHLNFIPASAKPPCVGIKDGGITRTELPGGMWEVVCTVSLVTYVQLLKDEASIMGDASAGKKGVLDIVDDIHSSLDENLLGITGMIEAFSPSETESEMFGDEKEGLQRKTVTYRYVKQETRASGVA